MKNGASAKAKDDWFEYKLEHDPRFQKRVAKARASLRAGKGIPWEDIEAEEDRRGNSPK